MKRLFSVLVLFCMIGTGLSACSSAKTAELPSLTVGGIIQANTGAHSWNVKQGLGNWMAQEASVVFPLDYPDDYPALSVPQDGVIALDWDIPPDSYTVSYWKEAVWNDGMEAEMTEAQENDLGFQMPEEDAPAIVTVRAVWEKQILCSSYGDVEYIFKIVQGS